jgi:hypothetical protein
MSRLSPRQVLSVFAFINSYLRLIHGMREKNNALNINIINNKFNIINNYQLTINKYSI